MSNIIDFKIQGKNRLCNVQLHCKDNLELKNLKLDPFDIVICDGPYGIVPPNDLDVAGFACEWDDFILNSKKDAKRFRAYYRTLFDVCLPHLKKSASIFICGFPEGTNIIKGLLDEEYDLNFRRSISWVYENHYDFDQGANFHRSHETVLYYTCTKDFVFHSGGVRDVLNHPIALRELNAVKDGAKPLGFSRFLLDTAFVPGGRLLSLFAGSGTDLIAATEYDMDAAGFEFNPVHVDIITNRLNKRL